MTPSFLKGRAELSVPLLLAVVGVVLAVDAAGLPSVTAAADPIGSRPVPFMVSALLLVCAALLVADILRGGRGEVEGGEDIDLSHPSDWRTVGLLLAAFVANIVLIDRAGWVISGAILFWGSCFALGSRRYFRDAAIATALSTGTFYGFYLGLGIKLPAGILQGVL
ncbi:MAG TPA: tripartite tricarboxylate transporter TctB family protein [Dermatophilaceae bacterium]|nr:tripartite tricarboxylate transporter TctB family protein [Dermatophilaceae bacterium]